VPCAEYPPVPGLGAEGNAVAQKVGAHLTERACVCVAACAVLHTIAMALLWLSVILLPYRWVLCLTACTAPNSQWRLCSTNRLGSCRKCTHSACAASVS
jgi:hypothetical protein